MLPEQECVGLLPISKYFIFCDDQQRQHSMVQFHMNRTVLQELPVVPVVTLG